MPFWHLVRGWHRLPHRPQLGSERRSTHTPPQHLRPELLQLRVHEPQRSSLLAPTSKHRRLLLVVTQHCGLLYSGHGRMSLQAKLGALPPPHQFCPRGLRPPFCSRNRPGRLVDTHGVVSSSKSSSDVADTHTKQTADTTTKTSHALGTFWFPELTLPTGPSHPIMNITTSKTW
jgi:hypothetical protein